MNALRYVFLESPYVLIPLLLIAAYICLVRWLRQRTPQARRALLIALLLLVALPLVQKVVETKREQLWAVCNQLVESYKAGDVDAIGRHVARNFHEEDLDRAGLLDVARRSMNHYRLYEAKLSSLSAEITGNRAVVKFTASVDAEAPEFGRHAQGTTWTADFEWSGDAWQLTGVRPRETPLFPYSRLSDLAR